MLGKKVMLIGGAALVLSLGGGSLVLGDTFQKNDTQAQVIELTPTVEPSMTPTATPTDEPIPTIKIWPTNTPVPQPTAAPKTETKLCANGECSVVTPHPCEGDSCINIKSNGSSSPACTGENCVRIHTN